MTFDPVVLARVQFALTVTFHIIFPTMSIGLATFLAVTEGLWLYTKNDLYLRIYRFWLTPFALGFGVGVVTGIVLSFEFGTNFSTFARMTGPVLGPMIGLEVLTSFFLEAGFLGIMLFGMERVGRKLHFAATCLVAFGTLFSASWILSANSWMQTPAGFSRVGDHFEVINWLAVIFNPSYPFRLPHMLLAAMITAGFLVTGIGAYYLHRARHLDFARKTVSLGLGFVSLCIATQLFLGDILGGVIAQHQPSKMEAIEGNWEDTPRAPYLFLIVPNSAAEKNEFQLGIPYLGSILVTHSVDGVVPGLKDTPRDLRPAMGPVFYAFRLMYVVGTLMFIVACIGLWLRATHRLFNTAWFHRLLIYMTPSGFLATIGGWYTAEMGRQPWVVFGALRTADAVSPVPAQAMLVTLIVIASTYALFFSGFLVLFLRVIAKGPDDPAAAPAVSGSLKRALMPNPAASVENA